MSSGCARVQMCYTAKCIEDNQAKRPLEVFKQDIPQNPLSRYSHRNFIICYLTAFKSMPLSTKKVVRMCVSPICASAFLRAGLSLPNSYIQHNYSRPALSLPCCKTKCSGCNARSHTKVNNFILCLKYVSLWLCKAAHRHSCVGLKELLLINESESERESESQSERNSLPQFSFKQALPTGFHCLDWGIMGSLIYRF